MIENKIKVMIVDDIESHRRRFGRIIRAQEDMELVGEAATGQNAISLALLHHPDVILMDIEMESKTAGIDAAERLVEQLENIKIIMLTVHEDDSNIFQSYCAGIKDYLFKSSSHLEIITAIQNTYQNASPIHSNIAEKIRNEFQRMKIQEASFMYILNVFSKLTVSETEVLKFICQGKTHREIAAARFVEYDTVKKQISSILKKFNCNTTSELKKIIKKSGLLNWISL